MLNDNPVVAIGVRRGGVGRDDGPRWRLVRASQGQPTTGISAAASSHRLGHLTFTPPALIIIVANVSFWPRLTGGDPEGTVGRNPTIGVT
jgi:hypothetical protein